MRQFKLLTIAAGAMALVAGAAPAHAQDEAEDSFSGVYVGGSVGLTFNNNRQGERIIFDAGLNGSYGDVVRRPDGLDAFSPGFCNGAATTTAPVACKNDKDDIEYYVRVGADQQYGKFVVGAVGEFGKSQVSDSVSAFSTTPAAYTLTREIEWNAALRARAGYVAGQSTMFYGTFGASYAKIDRSFYTINNNANSFTVTGDDDAWGWQAGGGIEQKIGNNFSVGLEYLYSRYNDENERVRVGQGTAGAANPFVLAGGVDMARTPDKFSFHAIRATAAFRF